LLAGARGANTGQSARDYCMAAQRSKLIYMKRRFKIFGSSLVAIFLIVFRFAVDLWDFVKPTKHGAHPIAMPAMDDAGDDAADTASILERAKRQVLPPPPPFQPMRQEAWPWWNHEEDHAGYELNRQIIRNRNADFLLTVNGAHRQAMNRESAS